MVKFTITPTKRSVDDDYEGTPVTETKVIADNEIAEIISFDKGVIEVQYGNGSMERRTGGTISWRYNNPGNIKHGKFAEGNGAVGPGDGNHAVFPSYVSGEEAMKKLIFSDARGFNTKSIIEMLKIYAPASDGNDPVRYAKHVASAIGVSVDTKINTLNARQKADMIAAMIVAEGFKVGTVQRIQ